MSVITGKLGTTGVTLAARAKGRKIPPALLQVPGGLYPMYSAAYEVDEYRLLNGWPTAVPPLDIRIHCLVSADGEKLTVRDSPLGVVTEASYRWVADFNYYDPIALQWTPVQGDCPPWSTSSDHAPTLMSDYEYQIGDERFVEMQVLNFDSNTTDYMWNDLNSVMGGLNGYTVIMVLNPNSIYGNDPEITENALWSPSTLDDAWAYFTVTDQAVFMTTESNASARTVSIGSGLSETAPTYLALVVSRPQTTVYAASGASNMRSKSLVAGTTPEGLSAQFWLGNAPSSSSGTMDMALLDLGIYPNVLTRAEVHDEFATLSGAYGGDK